MAEPLQHGRAFRSLPRADLSLAAITALDPGQRERLFSAVARLYSELEIELEALPRPCTACGACCRFGQHGQRLYASAPEMAYVFSENPPIPRADGADTCVYLTPEGRCGARARRMLGCRTYYSGHTRTEAARAQEIHERYLGLLKKLCRNHGLGWNYADCMAFYAEQREAPHNPLAQSPELRGVHHYEDPTAPLSAEDWPEEYR